MRPRSFSFAFKALKVASGLALITTLIAPGSALAGRSQIVKVSGVDISCGLASADASGGLFAITRDRTDGGSFAFLDLFVEPNDPAATVLSGGMDDPPLTTGGLQTTFDMADDATGDVIGSASISALFTPTGAQRLRRVSQDGVQKGIFSTYSVAGTLTVTSGAVSYTFDMAGCDAAGNDRIDQGHDPNGPKAGGPVPANDTPAGAQPVTVGGHLQMWTNGASLASEAACTMTDGSDVFDFPLGRTVWFNVTGTGGPITVDPARSSFDTVIAVYLSGASGLAQVACVDDADGSTQGAVTFQTQLGTTYFVQIGGVLGDLLSDSQDPQFGRLRLDVY